MNFIRYSVYSLAFILFVSLASAKELKSDELNYAVTIPDGWTVTFQNFAGFSIASQDGKKTITLLVRSNANDVLDPGSIAIVEQGLQKAGAQIVSSRNFMIDGVPAYENVFRVGKTPYASSFVVHQIIADNKFYSLQSGYMGGDAAQDSGMQEALASFHFLQPPKPSKPSGSGGFASHGARLVVLGIIVAGIVFGVIRSRKT